MTDETTPLTDTADAPAAASQTRLGPLRAAVAIVFGLFYAYALWAALSRLIDLPHAFDDAGAGVAPWGYTVGGVFVPIVAYGLAFWLGRRRGIGDAALLFLAGLLVVAAVGFSLIGFENAALAAAIG